MTRESWFKVSLYINDIFAPPTGRKAWRLLNCHQALAPPSAISPLEARRLNFSVQKKRNRKMLIPLSKNLGVGEKF